MCGRFVLHRPLRDWTQQLMLPPVTEDDFPFQWPPQYNIAPTMEVMTVFRDHEVGKTPIVFPHRWGLVPFWADDVKIGNRMINARSETAFEKPAFRAAFKRRRCLIPADGYYEWKKTSDGKQPYYIHDAGDRVIAMAGLWEENHKVNPSGDPLRTCTILTTSANSITGQVHDRMPVVIGDDDFDAWLDPDNNDTQSLRALMKPAADDAMTLHAVTKSVGNVRNQGPGLIRPLGNDQDREIENQTDA